MSRPPVIRLPWAADWHSMRGAHERICCESCSIMWELLVLGRACEGLGDFPDDSPSGNSHSYVLPDLREFQGTHDCRQRPWFIVIPRSSGVIPSPLLAAWPGPLPSWFRLIPGREAGDTEITLPFPGVTRYHGTSPCSSPCRSQEEGSCSIGRQKCQNGPRFLSP